MEFQVVLTERCNLACKYCYMNHNANHMTKETFDAHYAMLPKIMEQYSQHTYTAALFGGEPLLNWDLIQYIVPILKADPKCKFIIAMSNGLVLQDTEKYEWLQQNGIALSLSFDGLWNKINRVLPDGSSSFDEYIKPGNLNTLLRKGGGCKVMVSPDSLDTLVENYRWFVEDFGLAMPDYTIVRDNVWSDDDVKKMDTKATELADQVIEYILAGKATNVGFFKLYILDLLFGKTYGKRPFGCFAGVSGAGFMPNGKVYPCARFGSSDIGELANSMTGKINNDNLTIFSNPKLKDPRTYEKCNSCIIKQYCNAGCTFSQLKIKDGELISEPVENVCRILRILYRESIRMTELLKDNIIFQNMIKNSIENVG